MLIRNALFLLAIAGCAPAFAFDDANDSLVDKADRNNFEDFHKDSAQSMWGKDKKKDDKTVTTYQESTPADKKPANDNMMTDTAPGARTTARQTFDKGTELKVREAYKLSSDPSLKNIPTLYEAIESLHRQLNSYCPNGWKKVEEWDLPQANYFYIHYRAICK